MISQRGVRQTQRHVRKCPIDTNVNYNSQKLIYYGLLSPSRWIEKKKIIFIYTNRSFPFHLD